MYIRAAVSTRFSFAVPTHLSCLHLIVIISDKLNKTKQTLFSQS